jgi:hypothetical protein
MIIGYKLFRKMKDGALAPLFIDQTLRLRIGETHVCKEDILKNGFAKRIGWHGCYRPYAPHLVLTPKNGAKRVWVEIAINDGWLEEYARPEVQGGVWFTCEKITLLRELTEAEVDDILRRK